MSYRAVGWIQNGSAGSKHELLSQLLLYLNLEGDAEDIYDVQINPYRRISESMLEEILENLDAVLLPVRNYETKI